MNVLALVGGVSGVATASHAVIGVTTCLVLLGFELPQRVAGLRSGSVSLKRYAAGTAQIACRCMPELLGVVLCLIVAVALRIRGNVDDVMLDEYHAQAWEEVKVEWPLLMTADSLLIFQSWLRLLALLFVAARTKVGESTPLGGVAAVLLLSAMVSRAAMAARTSEYLLEGPLSLGGDLPVACEVAMIPRLAWLSVKAFREAPVAATTWVSVTAWFASFHYLNLAANPDADKLFTLANALECVAAIAFLCNTIVAHCGARASKGSMSAGFMHLVMPFQAALSSYFFLEGFPSEPSQVGSGRPFCLLVWSNLLQFGAYLVAAAFFVASQFAFDDASASDEQDVVLADPTVSVNLPSSEVVDASAQDMASAIAMGRVALLDE